MRQRVIPHTTAIATKISSLITTFMASSTFQWHPMRAYDKVICTNATQSHLHKILSQMALEPEQREANTIPRRKPCLRVVHAMFEKIFPANWHKPPPCPHTTNQNRCRQ